MLVPVGCACVEPSDTPPSSLIGLPRDTVTNGKLSCGEFVALVYEVAHGTPYLESVKLTLTTPHSTSGGGDGTRVA